MSSKVKPIDVPAYFTMALMAAVISPPWIYCHLLPFLKLEIGVLPVARWHHRYATRRCMAATGHSWGWPVRPCQINSPLTPFFWVVKRRLKLFGLSEHSVKRRCGVVGMLSNEEFDVLETEGVLDERW